MKWLVIAVLLSGCAWLQPEQNPPPQAIGSGTLGNWFGAGLTAIEVTGEQWTHAEASWSCDTEGVITIDPLVSSSARHGSATIVLTRPTSPTIRNVAVLAEGGCEWRLAIWGEP